jgi:hypothetical protein
LQENRCPIGKTDPAGGPMAARGRFGARNLTISAAGINFSGPPPRASRSNLLDWRGKPARNRRVPPGLCHNSIENRPRKVSGKGF